MSGLIPYLVLFLADYLVLQKQMYKDTAFFKMCYKVMNLDRNPSWSLNPASSPSLHTHSFSDPHSPPGSFLPVCGLNTTHGPNSQVVLISQADHKLNLTPLCELCSGSQTHTGLLTGSCSQESHNH